MTRILIHVEGQTEEVFVNEILRDHLVRIGYKSVSARIVGNARLQRGGIRRWPSVRKGIINHLKEDSGCIATTMVDYYGLPHGKNGGWPGRAEASGLKSGASTKASFVENALRGDLADAMGKGFDNSRFIPFVVMHEFEALLFSDCAAFSSGIGRPNLAEEFTRVRNEFDTPEEINDSPDTAPSKRVGAIVPGYEKPLLGTLAILEIGLQRIRQECPHFNDWLGRLEQQAG